MIPFSIICISYVGILLFARPDPGSLKAQPYTFTENFKFVQASLFSGVAVLLVYFVTTDFGFFAVNEKAFNLLALNSDFDRPDFRPTQFLTHSLVHANPFHVLTNVAGLGIASFYERRVGGRRFLVVLLVGIAASIPSFYFYSESLTFSGISGGVFGVAAAYFTDDVNVRFVDWAKATLFVVFLMTIIVIQSELQHSGSLGADVKVDHIGHILGAIGGIAYCRMRPRSTCSQVG